MKNTIITLILLLGAFAAMADNIVSLSSASGHPQDEVTLSVSLANTDAAVAFQTEIPLGSQLTYVAGSVALNPERITDHQVSAAVVGGSLRIYAFSLSLTPFVGNEGNLLSFTLRLKNEPGTYVLNMSQTLLSDAAGNALPVTTNNGTVTILSPKLQINTPSLNYGHVPIRSEYTKTATVKNIGNEPLVITAITFSDAVFSCPNFTETTVQPNSSKSFTFKFAPILKGAVTATATIVSNSIAGNGIINLIADPYAVNEIHIDNVTGYCDSVVEIPIRMNNMEEILGFQIEMNLSQALEYVDFTLSNRKADHVSVGVFNEGLLRLMAYSASGSAFTGEDGMIGTLRLRLHGLYGNYYLNPSKAVLADANGEDALSAKYQGRVTIRSPKINGNNTLDFGSSPVTEVVTREYVVRNQGNASMRIDQVVFDQSDFSVAETFPITVQQNASITLHVSYDREQKGDFTALMKIYSNDPQNGLKNVALSGSRYEPNNLVLSANPFILGDGDVAVLLAMNNYSGIVAVQANFHYPYEDYSVQASDFQLTERFANHFLYAIPLNDSTFRILVLSLQNTPVEGHDGAVLNVTLHPIGTPSEEEYTVSVSDIVLSGVEGINLFTGEDTSTTFSLLMVTQSIQLSQGWNWFSTYLDGDPIELLEALQDGLGDNGVSIEGPEGINENLGDGYWWGDLDEIGIASGTMYLILVEDDCTVNLTGMPVDPSTVEITINPGYNWIGFPGMEEVEVEVALQGFEAEDGDAIEGPEGMTEYLGDGMWWGDFDTFVPGQGYMYNSASGEVKTLIFQTGGSKARVKAVSPNKTKKPRLGLDDKQ